ncbi:uncharacterized copper-binding protein [Aeropyrum camini SY1 = JCM 12091]|uniref:Uncharacterized copper-binding protein n=1 Tax=Aeropyrum camini SY1 = JCM 12091 TaxID=1198449 RepID=U3T856_9CREN|nr:uncharacterized copper-binding protein [Aeropyrum camini SY1 = JCM 12091]
MGAVGVASVSTRYALVGLLVAVIAIVAIAYLYLGGGGYGGQETTSPGEEATGAGGGTVVKVELYEWGIKIEKTTFEAGEKVVFEVVNKGSYTHAFEIENDDIGFEVETENLAPGESAKLEVVFPQPGEYEVYCPIDGHRDLGMEALITVSG